jgi:RNase P subunit RPR2
MHDLYYAIMSKNKFDEKLCKECHQPLFLDKEECKEFIEKKIKQGYFVCKCCGSKNKMP